MDLRRGRVRLRVPERLNLKNRLLGQCQTKSFLGNLVCFKTCNHDLRNSLNGRILGFGPVDGALKRDETSTSRIVASARFARKIPVLVLIGPYFKDTFERQ